MGIEITENGKETRVKQVSMLNTQRYLFGLKIINIYAEAFSVITCPCMIYGETTVFSLVFTISIGSKYRSLCVYHAGLFLYFSAITIPINPTLKPGHYC